MNNNICLNHNHITKEEFKNLKIWYNNRFKEGNFKKFVKKLNIEVLK